MTELMTKEKTYYELNKEARKQFQKNYYETNKDKIKEYYSNDEMKAKRAAYMREYRLKKKASAN